MNSSVEGLFDILSPTPLMIQGALIALATPTNVTTTTVTSTIGIETAAYTPELFISIIALAVAVFAVAVPWYYQNQQNRLAGLAKAHDMLANDNARESRWKIYRAYDYYKESSDLREFDNISADVTNVEGDLDIIGAMVIEDIVPREAFLDTYAGLVIRSWTALERKIKAQREGQNHSPRFMWYFERLNKLAIAYWKKKYPTDNLPVPYFDRQSQYDRGTTKVLAEINPISILKVRLANGEITLEQYESLLEKLSGET